MERKTLQLLLLTAWVIGMLVSVGEFIYQVENYRAQPEHYGFLEHAPLDTALKNKQLEEEIDKVSDKYFNAVAGFFSPWIAVVAAMFLVRASTLSERLDRSLAYFAIGLTCLVQFLVLFLNWFYITNPSMPYSTHYLTKTIVPVITSILGAIATFAFPKESSTP
jgi:hypothetical protein